MQPMAMERRARATVRALKNQGSRKYARVFNRTRACREEQPMEQPLTWKTIYQLWMEVSPGLWITLEDDGVMTEVMEAGSRARQRADEFGRTVAVMALDAPNRTPGFAWTPEWTTVATAAPRRAAGTEVLA